MAFEDIAKNMVKRHGKPHSARYNRIVSRIGVALAGLGLIGLGVVINAWARATPSDSGTYWQSDTLAGLGVFLLIVAVTGFGKGHGTD